ncbi:succinylglutamate desuccinylase/aspartoacylase family protein [Natronococcus occultus]|nr:succinylglutamate desuccinylase/aspartoacylase family protein [Natronococcus occultus]
MRNTSRTQRFSRSSVTDRKQVGTAKANPGEIDVGTLCVGEARDGSPVELPVVVINGTESGKTLYIQAASDGDELNGVGVVHQLVPQLDPSKLSGAIMIVGIVNYYGFQVAEHRNPIDDTKINRAYRGNEAGSSSERIAYATYDIASNADLILDLHQASTSKMVHETRVRCGSKHRLHDQCLKLARAFGCGHIMDKKGPRGQLARVAPNDGIPTIDPELGGAVGWDKESIRVGVEGVFNVLQTYDFLTGQSETKPQVRANDMHYYSAPAGGLVQFEKELGQRVSRRETLFTVTDLFGAPKEEVVADESGIFWRCRRLPQVASGEYVCSVGTNIDEY